MLADGQVLAANSNDMYTITAIATLDADVDVDELVCPPSGGEGNGGFLNRADLVVDGEHYPADACDNPDLPTVDKIAGTVTAQPNGNFVATYTIKVHNPGDEQVYYDLSDTTSFPAGVTVVSATVDGNPLVNPIADDKALAAGATDTYALSFEVSVSSTVTTADLKCQTKGLLNTGTVISSNQTDSDAVCMDLPTPVISHTKTVEPAKQLSNGSWEIVYTVTVKNTGTVPGRYTLDDALQMPVPDVIGVNSSSAVGPGGPIGGWTGTGSNNLATDAVLLAGGQAVYTITVNASIAAGKMGDPAVLCGTTPGANGFLNGATLTVNGLPDLKTACTTPSVPEIVKQWTSTAPTGTNTWSVSYLITVDNSKTGARDNYYTLKDVLGFPVDVTNGPPVVTDTTGGGSTSVPWNNGDLVTVPKLIPAGQDHTYTVVVPVTVPAGAKNLACLALPTPGNGLVNSVSLSVGADTFTAKACGPVDESASPTILKDLVPGYPKQQDDGSWLIQYKVTVTGNATKATTYELQDVFEFGEGITITAGSAEIISSGGVPVSDTWDGTDAHSDVTTGEVGLPANRVGRVRVPGGRERDGARLHQR